MIAAEDTGTSVRDMDLIYSRTRFASCISEAIGGSGHPAVATAQGVVRWVALGPLPYPSCHHLTRVAACVTLRRRW